MAYLAEQRDKMFVSAVGVGEIDIHLEEGDLCADLFCAACSYQFDLSEVRGLYECSVCGVEVTEAEAKDLARRYVVAVCKRFQLDDLNDKRGFWWRLKTLFGGTKKQQASLKP